MPPPDLHKQVVDPVWGCKQLDGEILAFHEISRVHIRCVTTEAPQDQVMVCVVLCIPERHVLEQTTVCAHYVVGPGEHLPSSTANAPHPAVLQPQLLLWEEVSAHVFQPCRCQGCHNLLVPCPPLWCYQVSVKITGHQQCVPLRPLTGGRDDVLYCRGVVWGQVSSHDVPLLAAQRQLKAHDVRVMEL